MEALPRGANFVRAKTLWEIGLHITGNPATPYGGNRDMIITVGSGSGAQFRPWLRLATGSAILAEDVASGGVELAFVNPSALLTQAYRGVGLFRAPLPVRIIAVYPSWDRFVFMVHAHRHPRAERYQGEAVSVTGVRSRGPHPLDSGPHRSGSLAARLHAARHRILGWASRRLRLALRRSPHDVAAARRARRNLRRGHQDLARRGAGLRTCSGRTLGPRIRAVGAVRMASGCSSASPISPLDSGCGRPRFQRLADLCERIACGADGPRHLRRHRGSHGRDPLGRGHRRQRTTDGARERRDAHG